MGDGQITTQVWQQVWQRVWQRVWRRAGRTRERSGCRRSDKQCARTNQWGGGADRLSVPLTQVKALKTGRDVLIVLPGSIG